MMTHASNTPVNIPGLNARLLVTLQRDHAQVPEESDLHNCGLHTASGDSRHAGDSSSATHPCRAIHSGNARPRGDRSCPVSNPSRLRKNYVGTADLRWPARLGQEGNTPAGWSNRPDFSPARPWRAETRLVPSKAAALRLTLVSRFTSYLARFLRAKRARRWRNCSASC